MGWLSARREQRRAVDAETNARREAEIAKAVGGFLTDMLASANPRGAAAAWSVPRELTVV